jgi:hypothetical protein
MLVLFNVEMPFGPCVCRCYAASNFSVLVFLHICLVHRNNVDFIKAKSITKLFSYCLNSQIVSDFVN